jgi:hypothetical protein
MRQANQAIQRERFLIPTVDELLSDVNGSTIFSKLDFRSAYHQIELMEESRVITTFSTHLANYRYTRLMFGASCSPEMYQWVMEQEFHECKGKVIFFL